MLFSPLKQGFCQVKDIIETCTRRRLVKLDNCKLWSAPSTEPACLNPKMSLFLDENSLIHQCNSSNFFKTISHRHRSREPKSLRKTSLSKWFPSASQSQAIIRWKLICQNQFPSHPYQIPAYSPPGQTNLSKPCLQQIIDPIGLYLDIIPLPLASQSASKVYMIPIDKGIVQIIILVVKFNNRPRQGLTFLDSEAFGKGAQPPHFRRTTSSGTHFHLLFQLLSFGQAFDKVSRHPAAFNFSKPRWNLIGQTSLPSMVSLRAPLSMVAWSL